MDIGIFTVVDELFLSSLAEGKEVRLRVDGTSMSPLLKPGDQVVLQRATPQQLQKGDLVVVRRQHDMVTHRLVHQNAGQWLTKGDNSRYPDLPALENQVLGKVIAIEKNKKTIDLQSTRWQILNRWLANWSWLEASLFHFGRQIKSSAQKSQMEGVRGNHSWLARFLSLPFRLVYHLIIKLL